MLAPRPLIELALLSARTWIKDLGSDNPDNNIVFAEPGNYTVTWDGAAITISVMTLAAAHTVGINVDIPSALLLSFLSALAACGASGVAGGSLLLIPMACSMFGISNDQGKPPSQRS